MNITRFESLGDNCELGFVLKRHQIGYSSLLRWSITSIPVLCDLLRTDFAGLYAFDNLEPCAPKMLLDRGTGVKFHSDMVRDRKFVANHRAVYDQEINKVMHLRLRLQTKLRDPNAIVIYKDKHTPPQSAVQDLADLVSARGGANLLYVTKEGDQAPGSVVRKGPHLYYGRIDRFAEYATVQDSSADVWDAILGNADQMCPMTEPAVEGKESPVPSKS
ncbi:hypothetical protein [Puniceibacterium sp. IMCC21224]|uniref:hypothetical protein n=1 Tax=Puniceibacterium sp. IMCC21224 TaxID=1618204 RepID=UPI00064DD3C9|nr:hypothetical protein [Puniceibacterium sp. IMCC21224]KMK63961.1 putative papain-like cysteine peptidase (DUF1796) [Puniceibacterium sp. IMCC21224]